MAAYSHPTIRRLIALFLLAVMLVISVVSSFNEFSQMRQFMGEPKPDGITVWKDRMVRVVRALPAEGVIGYLSERDFDGLGFNPIDQDEEFAITQYWLSPRILVEGDDQPVAVVNLADFSISEVQQLLAGKNLRLDDEFGFGLYLARKVSP
jgi:hypothetical protein